MLKIFIFVLLVVKDKTIYDAATKKKEMEEKKNL